MVSRNICMAASFLIEHCASKGHLCRKCSKQSRNFQNDTTGVDKDFDPRETQRLLKQYNEINSCKSFS